MTAIQEIETSANINRTSPLNLDSLLDEIANQITEDSIVFPSHFSFTRNNIHFAGQLLYTKENDLYCLNLVANLGYIPFSAEDKIRRKKLMVTFAPLFLKGDYILSQNSQIQMILITNFTGPANAKKIMEVITYTLLDMQENLKSIQKSIFA